MSELSHLDELEAEAIYIIREVAAECEKPVMLYSIGKDSSVMLHLAMKAFYPEKPPFPFLHIDTTWKFHEMIEFRDRIAKENGIDMLVYTNEEGVKAGINPFDNGSAYTDIMKTQALKQALTKYGFTAAFGGGRRDELDRRDLKGLPERNRRKLHRTDLILCVHDCTGFSRHIDSSSVQQPELLHALVKRICTHPKPYRHKHRIAGIFRTFHKILCSMASSVRTVDSPVLHQLISGTVEIICQFHNTLF